MIAFLLGTLGATGALVAAGLNEDASPDVAQTSGASPRAANRSN